ncbi:putative efflux pump membrane fusion protein [Anatilimnocola aggregata]|uniref:Putative efflux pump membrane fusion protein n=1 Tax=Anatilimnocola aggregata TaxID=2528021 RepID=A0A517Y7A7_9BACT|nr:HlyD family efflux transporter periplasmic adaptor subunit [Anatilimnocola aggregata]QDU26106.1 putative efflux pump membrane fusion protein [Anatilimnocola aggregata]
MKHIPKYLAGTVGVVAIGWLVQAGAQQPAPPRTFAPAPGAFAPAAPAAAPNFAPAAPYTATATTSTSPRQLQQGEIAVPYGLVTVIDDVKVPARDAGSLTKVFVRGGELVQANVILGQIDDRDTLAKQRIAQGELDAATEQANSKAEIEAAEKGRDVALAEYESAQDLKVRNPGAISTQEVRRAKFQWERSLAQIAVAKTDNVVAGLTAVMKQAQLDATTVELSKKKIVSPIQGQVVEVYKHEGEWVQPGDPVLRLVRLDRVRVEGFVYANDGGRNDVEGKPVKVLVDLPGNRKVELEGRVDYASPIIEGSGQNRQYRIWADVDNQFVDGHWVIQPGASAELRINIAAAKLPAPEREAPPTLEAAPAAVAPASSPAAAPASALPAFGPRTEAAPAEAPTTENALVPAPAPATIESLRPESPPAVSPAPVAPAPVPAPVPAATRPSLAPPSNTAPAVRPMTTTPSTVAPRPAPTQPASTAAPARPAQPRPAISGVANPSSPPVPRRNPNTIPPR